MYLKTLTGRFSLRDHLVGIKQTKAKLKLKKMATEEKIFADGFSFKRNENAPDFVIGRLSLKVDDAISFMKEHDKRGWVNLNVKQARSGNYYIELDTYEPKGKAQEDAPKPAKQGKSKPKDEDDDSLF